jgi:hypothetical protein
MSSARKGKVASLPATIREEVNKRLFDGQQSPQIIKWLHEQPEVLRILDDRWGEEPVNAQNISEWRKGGYQDWLDRREKVSAIKTLSDYSLKLAQAAGGSLTEGALAIGGGKILEFLETAAADESKQSGEGFDNLINALVALRHAELAGVKSKQNEVVLQQRERALALEEKRFRRQTAELFLDWYADKRAIEIAEGKADHDVKVEDLSKLLFGERPTEA